MENALPDQKGMPRTSQGSDELPFNFIHIDKWGRTSVRMALGLPTLHWTAALLRQEIGASRWVQMPSFAIVRNPYSRLASI
ncbi:MAG: hypothetical protein AB3N24_10335 [Leisingera sp.]